jgi:hypothetical protein
MTKQYPNNEELRKAIAAFRKANPGQTPVVGSSVESGITIRGMGPLYEDSGYKQLTTEMNLG